MLGLVAIAALQLSGCATIVKGTAQSVTVATDPSGAQCTLSRDGSDIAVVNPTPGSVLVEKDKDPISLICRKEGFQDNVGTMASTFQGMTLGNIIFGGVIGVVVDAGSGAMNQYPPTVTITMIPKTFDSRTQRDAFFAKLKADFQIEADQTIKRIKTMCVEATCETQLKAASTAKDSRLLEIERMREAAVYRGM